MGKKRLGVFKNTLTLSLSVVVLKKNKKIPFQPYITYPPQKYPILQSIQVDTFSESLKNIY
jgi:hypothetical protein